MDLERGIVRMSVSFICLSTEELLCALYGEEADDRMLIELEAHLDACCACERKFQSLVQVRQAVKILKSSMLSASKFQTGLQTKGNKLSVFNRFFELF